MNTSGLNKATYHFIRAVYFYIMNNPIWYVEQAKALKAAGLSDVAIVRKLPKNARPNSWRRNANKRLQTEECALSMNVANTAMSPMIGKLAVLARQ